VDLLTRQRLLHFAGIITHYSNAGSNSFQSRTQMTEKQSFQGKKDGFESFYQMMITVSISAMQMIRIRM